MPLANSMEGMQIYFKIWSTVPHFLQHTWTGVRYLGSYGLLSHGTNRQQLSNVDAESTCSSSTAKRGTLEISCGPCSELSPQKKELSSWTRQRSWINDTVFPPKPCMTYHLTSGFATMQSPLLTDHISLNCNVTFFPSWEKGIIPTLLNFRRLPDGSNTLLPRWKLGIVHLGHYMQFSKAN